VLVVLVALVGLSWSRHSIDERRQREIRSLAVVVLGMLGLFSVAGFSRHDGLCYNQRYFLELTPLAALALAIAFDHVPKPPRWLLAGIATGGSLAVVAVLADPGSFLRTFLLLRGSVALAFFLALSGGLMLRSTPSTTRGRAMFSMLLGAALAWAAVVHVGDDMRATRKLRNFNAKHTAFLAAVIPNRAGLFTFGAMRDSAGPLGLTRDLVIADLFLDEGRDEPLLAQEMLRAGRRVFVDASRMPKDVLARATHDFRVVQVPNTKGSVLELRPQTP
jgi:hypothetical protein